jgi:hypothetical protein
MKHVTPYSVFESESEPIRKVFSREQLNWLNRGTAGSWKYNPQTGKVDVDGYFSCSNQGLVDFKDISFGVVKSFDCSRNSLTSLEGAPDVVKGNFDCGRNQLTSLMGGPQEVWQSYECGGNKLTSLIGAPVSLDGMLRCKNNLLTSVEGAPLNPKARIICSYNPVSDFTFHPILDLMKKGESYPEAVKDYWPRISTKEKALMYRPEFYWVSKKEADEFQAFLKYDQIRGMI